MLTDQSDDGRGGWRDVPYSIALDPSGNVYVSGYSEGCASPGLPLETHVTTVKYDRYGNELWVASYYAYGGCVHPPPHISVAVDDADNVYVGGTVWTSRYSGYL